MLFWLVMWTIGTIAIDLSVYRTLTRQTIAMTYAEAPGTARAE